MDKLKVVEWVEVARTPSFPKLAIDVLGSIVRRLKNKPKFDILVNFDLSSIEKPL